MALPCCRVFPCARSKGQARHCPAASISRACPGRPGPRSTRCAPGASLKKRVSAHAGNDRSREERGRLCLPVAKGAPFGFWLPHRAKGRGGPPKKVAKATLLTLDPLPPFSVFQGCTHARAPVNQRRKHHDHASRRDRRAERFIQDRQTLSEIGGAGERRDPALPSCCPAFGKASHSWQFNPKRNYHHEQGPTHRQCRQRP